MRHISKQYTVFISLFAAAALFTGACGDDVEEPPSNGRAGGGAGGKAGSEAGQSGDSLGGAGSGGEPAIAGAGGQAGGTDEAGSAGEAGAAGGTTGPVEAPGPEIPTYSGCFSGTPKTHEEIINACTDAERVDKNPDLPALPSQ